MENVVIAGAVRTAIGDLGGALRDVPAHKLMSPLLAEALRRAGVPAAAVDEVIVGCVGQGSEAPNIGRVAALLAGLPQEVPGFTVARNCASGLQAITSACQAIRAGDGEVYLVGGVESMSTAPYVLRGARFGWRLRHAQAIDSLWEGLTDPVADQLMGRTAENLAEMCGISRQEQDEFAVESHRRAFRAVREGRFRAEILPFTVPKGHGPPEVFSQDECVKANLSLQKLALYPAVFKEGGTVTSGNSCAISDGAAAMVVLSEKRATSLGVRPQAFVRSYAYAALAPEIMGLGPAHAVPRALAKAGLTLGDLDLLEVNEAFAAQYLAVERELGLDREKVNVNGGAIALGHPVGCTGARLVVTLIHELARQDLALGLATMCVGGGQGGAIVLERR